jgi:hypothetical protein
VINEARILSHVKRKVSSHAIFLKFGTFDQYDMRFSTGSRGNQCTCNCLVYLVLSFVKHDQNELDADNILNTGDQIYKKTVEKLKTEGKFTNMLNLMSY